MGDDGCARLRDKEEVRGINRRIEDELDPDILIPDQIGLHRAAHNRANRAPADGADNNERDGRLQVTLI